MAYLLINEQEDELTGKGVLVIKHTELKFLASMPHEKICVLRDKYFIGLYTGYSININSDPEIIDFYISGENVIVDRSGLKKPILNLNGFNFIADELADFGLQNPKYLNSSKYDFLYIGNSQLRKGLFEFLKAYSDVISHNPNARAFVLNRVDNNIEQKVNVRRIRKLYRLIKAISPNSLHYLEVTYSGDMLPKELMLDLYDQSLCLVCSSHAEGAARTVAEASFRNLAVISNRDMRGGTNNHLDENVDITYSGIRGLSEAMELFIERKSSIFSEGYTSRNKTCYLSSNSKKYLIEFLKNNFDYDVNTISNHINEQDLYNAFSAHQNKLPVEVSNAKSDEVFGYVKMYSYLNYLLSLSDSPPLQLKIRDFFDKLKAKVYVVKNIAKLAYYFWIK